MEKQANIFVAMSGGVDSSVAAALLIDKGCRVSGVTMCFELPPGPQSDKPRCCGLESIEDARRVCKALGIPHHVLNYGDALEEAVIKDFVSEYSEGRTPNPCVRCNTMLKFDRLFKDVQALGGTQLATGHYARIVHSLSPDRWELRKAKDAKKDQTYFLYGIRRELLPSILFPLGDLEKSEVREIARAKGLLVSDKKESQDICFVSDQGYQDFLKSRGAVIDRPGVYVDHTGKVVGKHQGVGHYTIGQREGLGIALGHPVYVYQIDPSTNTVFVGPRERLLARGLKASGLNLVGMNFSKETIEAGIKIRYNHFDILGRVSILDEAHVAVRFHEPQPAVTPGQSLVFYDGDRVLGGAVIDEAVWEEV